MTFWAEQMACFMMWWKWAKPIKQHSHRTGAKKREIMKQGIQYMLHNGIIERCCSPWSSPCLLTSVPPGSYRPLRASICEAESDAMEATSAAGTLGNLPSQNPLRRLDIHTRCQNCSEKLWEGRPDADRAAQKPQGSFPALS